jgi:hypothetical protein
MVSNEAEFSDAGSRSLIPAQFLAVVSCCFAVVKHETVTHHYRPADDRVSRRGRHYSVTVKLFFDTVK